MITGYYKMYSQRLGRDMESKVYGHGGRPVLFIPCQDGRFYDFENFRMTDAWAPWIDNGDVMVFAIDTIDKETWSDTYGNGPDRARKHEAWMQYIFEEVVPFIRNMCAERNHCDDTPGIIAFGCSLGATHAANLYLRRPDLFTGLLALSGIYTASYGFGTFMNKDVYDNSPVDYMLNFPVDHPYVDIYNNERAVICVGQGAWEQPETTRALESICKSKGINGIWFDYWGYDVNHDWPWWYKQVAYYVPYLLYQR